MNTEEKNQKFYNLVISFFKQKTLSKIELTDEELDKYFQGNEQGFTSMGQVFKQLIRSAQNQGHMTAIRFEENEQDIVKVLGGCENYRKLNNISCEDLYNKFKSNQLVKEKFKKGNTWAKWCSYILSSAKYLSEWLNNKGEFVKFVEKFDKDADTRVGLACLMAKQIKGIGFALACDFIKELGYIQFCKPDVHLKDVLSQTGMCSDDEIEVFKTIDKIANDNNVTPYKLDKIIWLICSGNFYLNCKKITKNKAKLITFLNNNINK